ncbi:DUF1127 domain-containing protein [Tropicimonas sp. IMCC6043]|uniref:DUF1127 domain-containing protein n=1 Tax=Tropicimonas sp. IMCC6043 TaxID=2510645 RepID=UPI00101C9A64|nr:DUF1127 domain-containing protein [Tropicimonas sp. IMCC6043]RYH10698.1 DUF1127 domain-containing protein [Tropicimonas sp. IMCC6043]
MAQDSSTTASRLDSLKAYRTRPLAADLLVLVAATLVKWDRNRRSRRVLAQLTPHQLRDVGLTPEMVSEELRKPFWLI